MDYSIPVNPGLVSTPTCSRRSSVHTPPKISWESSASPLEKKIEVHEQQDVFVDVDLHRNSLESTDSQRGQSCDTLENIVELGLSFDGENTKSDCRKKFERFSLEEDEDINTQNFELRRPFNKWARNLEQRASRRRKTTGHDTNKSDKGGNLFESPGTQRRSAHKKSSSGSSFGFVTAVKSASISFTSFSIAAKSKKTIQSSRQQCTDRSSKTSNTLTASEDSSYISSGIFVDQAVTKRSLQRRRVLEEIISTEESYVADIKFLTNVYVTLLASMPSLSSNLRVSITRNLNEILELHEELLGDLHSVVPYSEYTQTNSAKSSDQKSSRHQRWHSLDAVPENSTGVPWLQEIPGMTAEPKVAAEVAEAFGKKMNRLFIYEEYGAKYEMMIKDIGSTHRTIPQWKDFQKGLEALASSLASISYQQDNAKKAMTIGDLLVKPIQRICKYQLLFAELLKQTPVCDCPDSHMNIETVMIRLREATSEINRAAYDPETKNVMEKSWILQDRISFPDMPDARSKNLARNLGHIHLCGVLHVSWQTQNGVDGQYLICLLYRDYLLLASSINYDQVYTIQACIGLTGVRIEGVDNGRGLQCQTVQFSWKLVFESDHQLFELTMSACSPREEKEWRGRLIQYSCREGLDAGDQLLFSSICLPVKPLGTIFGKPGTIARRISVHRATTVGSISGLCQVIIKNTNVSKENPSSMAMIRSQSLLTTNRTAVLSPSRTERSRLEALLSDVWTRQVLPYPGMTHRARSEHIVRASASSVMRKLSVASIASNFTKQSGSMPSIHKTDEDGNTSKSSYTNSLYPYTDHVSDAKLSKLQCSSKSCLSKIPDDKENLSQRDSHENIAAMIFEINNETLGSARSDALKSENNFAIDTPQIKAQSIRSTSVNSTNLNKLLALPIPMAASVSMGKDTSENMNVPLAACGPAQSSWKYNKTRKMSGKSGSLVVEGIRNFFR
ncbi:putative dbl homology [Golovinomyces cichoracearum]|uniref:Putative dbl homology n=1 Tax=Golovinomyces cichoracearum TaxID=62708 RepID=A0A420HRH3_9PEZI|nr:putative dbl homology [Golovinomyces cichoracearum]